MYYTSFCYTCKGLYGTEIYVAAALYGKFTSWQCTRVYVCLSIEPEGGML